MKAKMIMQDGYVKGFDISAEVVETLILNKALAQYSENRENNVTDRLIALQMGRALTDEDRPKKSEVE